MPLQIYGLQANMATELLITSYYNIVKRTMIDMVPKAIMYTLVQYVPCRFAYLGSYADCILGSPRMRCSVNCSRICIATRNSTTCSRKAITRSADGKSASRWWRVCLAPARLSARCSNRLQYSVSNYGLFPFPDPFAFFWVLSGCVASEVLCFTFARRSDVKLSELRFDITTFFVSINDLLMFDVPRISSLEYFQRLF